MVEQMVLPWVHWMAALMDVQSAASMEAQMARQMAVWTGGSRALQMAPTRAALWETLRVDQKAQRRAGMSDA